MAGEVQYWDWALKNVYSPEVMWNQIVKPCKTLAELERTADFTVTQPTGQTLITVPVPLGLPQGYGTGGENSPLPTVGKTTGQQASYNSVQHTGVIGFTFRAKNAGKDRAAGWKSVPSVDMENIIKMNRMNINREVFGDSTGTLATCTAAGPVNTFTVSSTKYIYAHATNGMFIDLYDTNTSTYVAQNRQVTAKTSTTITIGGAAVTVTNTTIVVIANSYDQEMNGLANIVGTGTLGGIDPTVAGQESWLPASGAAYPGGAASPSLELFEPVFQDIEDNMGNVDFMVASNKVQTAAANYLHSFRRIPVTETVKLEGGFTGIDWNGIPLGRDRDCPSGTAYFITKDALKICEVIPAGWQELDADGSIIMWDAARGYKSVWIWDMNLVPFARNCLAVMTNIAES